MTSKLFIHPTTFVNTNDAISATDPDASVTISGGLAVQKKAYFATKIFTEGVDANNTIITQVATPVAATDAVNKSYVDGITISTDFSIDNNSNVLGVSSGALGTGLSGGSGVVISVAATQSFDNLTVTTSANFSGVTIAGVGTPSAATDGANKSYVDGLVVTAGTGLTKVVNALNVNASQTQITSIGTLTGLTVSGLTNLTNTTESTATTNGALTIAGGLGIVKNVFIGGNITIAGDFTANNASAQFASLTITDTTDSSSVSTGALVVPGGLGIAKKVFVGGATTITDTTSVGATVNSTTSTGGALNVGGDLVLGATAPMIHFPQNGVSDPVFTNRSAGTKLVLYPAISGALVDYAFGIGVNTFWASVPDATRSFKWYAGTTEIMSLSGAGVLTPAGGFSSAGALTISDSSKIANTANPTTSAGGALNVDGDVVLDATEPKLFFPPNGTGAPAFTNRSVGTKVILYPQIGASAVDYALGMESDGMWTSVADTAKTFRWYGGTTLAMSLSGDGNMTLAGTDKLSNTTNPTTHGGGALNVPGDITLDTDYPRIYFPTGLGANIPTFTNRSIGTKLVLWPNITGTTVDTAIGVAANTMWFSVEEALVSKNFEWYAGTTNVMTLTGTGNLSVTGTIQGNIQPGYTTTTTSAVTYILTMASNSRQFFTGTLDQLVAMPNPIGELLGSTFDIVNRSTGYITVQANNTVQMLGSSGTQGVAIGPNDYVKFTLVDNGSNTSGSWHAEFLSVGSQAVDILNTTSSTSTSTGALKVAGGVGVGENINLGGELDFGTARVYTEGNILRLRPDTGTVRISGDNSATVYSSELLLFTLNVSSSGNYELLRIGNVSTTGYEIAAISGGTGVARDLKLAAGSSTIELAQGGTTTFTSTTDSTSTVTGAVKIDGGVGIAKNINVGGTTNLIGAVGTNFLRFANAGGINYIQSGVTNTTSSYAPLKFTGINGSPEIMTLDSDNVTMHAGKVSLKANTGDMILETDSTDGRLFVTPSIDTHSQLRVAGGVAANTYNTNALMIFSLNNTALTNYELLLLGPDTTSDSYRMRSSNGGTGTLRKVELLTGSNDGQLVLETDGTVTMSSTTDSTIPTTGSVTVAGGLGIAKTLNLGDGMYVRGNSRSQSETYEITIGPAPSLSNRDYCSAIRSTSVTASHFGSSLFFATHSSVSNNADPVDAIGISNAQVVYIYATHDATSTTTGSLRVTGGVGIEKNLHVGGIIRTEGQLQVSTDLVDDPSSYTQGISFTSIDNSFDDDTTAASGTNSNFMKNHYFGITDFTATNATVTTTNAANVYIAGAPIASDDHTITNSYALYVNSGITRLDGLLGLDYRGDGSEFLIAYRNDGLSGLRMKIDGAGSATVVRLENAGGSSGAIDFHNGTSSYFTFRAAGSATTAPLSITDGTASTSSSTGALIVTGGAGIGGDIFLAGNISAVDNADASSVNIFKNASTGTSAHVYVQLLNDADLGLNLISTNTNYSGGLFSLINTPYQLNLQTSTATLLTLGTNGAIRVILSDTNVDILPTTSSTSPSTGALTVTGGVGIEENLNVGGTFKTFNYLNTNGYYVNNAVATYQVTTDLSVISKRIHATPATALNAVSTWYDQSSISALAWRSICWAAELGLFVAVASDGTGDGVSTSPDGKTWTTRTPATDNQWWSVCWAPELTLLVAVARSGTGDRVMTSPDGITWTSRTSAADNNWREVCWSPELSLFVAVSGTGTGDRVMTSPDGITWTSRTSAADDIWISVCWAPEISLFAAVSNDGTIMTSPDGIAWTTRTAAAANAWAGICWSPELYTFVAVSRSGTGDRVMTSPDGITWTSRTSAADNDWNSVVWAPELSIFVAVADTGTGNRIMTSPDSVTWTTRTSPVDNEWYLVCWSSEQSLFVSVSYAGTNRAMISEYGVPTIKNLIASSDLTAGTNISILGSTVSVIDNPIFVGPLTVYSNTLSSYIACESNDNGEAYYTVDNKTTSGWSFGQDTDDHFKIKGGTTGGDIFASATTRLQIDNSTGDLDLTSTTESTSSTTGAATVAGGVGIAKDLYVGEDIFSTGFVKIQGSGGTAKKTYIASTTIANTGPGATIMTFTTGFGQSYYAKVTVLLNETSNSNNTTCFQFEINGRHNLYNVFNIIQNYPGNAYVMTQSVTLGSTGTTHTYSFQPASQRQYYMAIYIDFFGDNLTQLTDITVDGSSIGTWGY